MNTYEKNKYEYMFNLVFNPQKIADALWIAPEDVITYLTDGRVAAKFAEIWVSNLYGLNLATNSNEKGSDAFLPTDVPMLGNDTLSASVKTLTKSGIKFQMSKFVGSGRTCTKDDLLNSILEAYLMAVVDIIDFPNVLVTVVKQKTLVKAVINGNLTLTGWNREKYYLHSFGRDLNDIYFKEMPV